MTIPPPADFQNRITGDGPLVPVIIRLAAPVVLMMYFQNAYNIIDTIWVGQLLGEVSLAGIGTGGYVLWMIFGLTGFVSVGLTAIIARRFGEGNIIEAELTATRGIWYSLVVSIFLGTLIWFFLPDIFLMMGADQSVTAQGMSYMKVLVFGIPFIFLSIAIQSMYQAAGDTITPMWLMAISLIINFALDPILMLGLFGAPRMGIAGAALATVLARFTWVALGLLLLVKGKRIGQREKSIFSLGPVSRLLPQIMRGPIKLHSWDKVRWRWSQFRQVLWLGLPHAFSMTLFPAVYMILVRIPSQYGAAQVAALRVGHTVEGMSFYLALGFMIATSTCVGQNLGAGKTSRANRSAWTASAMVASIIAIFSLCFYFFSHSIAAIFSPDPNTIAAAAVYLEILAISQVFMGVEIVLGGGFTGAGDTMPPMLVAVPLNIARIPIAYFLANTMGMGVSGVWWAISGTSIIKGLILAAIFLMGKWAGKKV